MNEAMRGLLFNISIHVPLAGDDDAGQRSAGPESGFLSTSPLRGTTCMQKWRDAKPDISIHVPLAGDDTKHEMQGLRLLHFYPRPPCGGRHDE